MSGTITTLAVPERIPTPAELKKQQTIADTETLVQAFHRDQLRWRNVDWVVTLFLISVHVGCLAAPFFFSWTALAVCLTLHWLTCSIGICLGYHRYLAHKSMKLKSPAEFFVLMCGCLSGEGSPLTWAATHRLHHQKSDQAATRILHTLAARGGPIFSGCFQSVPRKHPALCFAATFRNSSIAL